MKILILTQYFPPETGAPQNRLYDLSHKLAKMGDEVTILTTFPSYPQNKIFDGYEGKWFLKEKWDQMTVLRSWIYTPSSRTLTVRLLNYFSFVITSLFIGVLKTGQVDIIFCESPPLFLGWTAVILKKVKKAKLVFNVSDLWPESAVKLGIIKNRFLIFASEQLENWIYTHSDRIIGQTKGIIDKIKGKFPEKPTFWFPNGVDPKDIDSRKFGKNWRFENGFSEKDYLIYFGGLMGYAQGLEVILKAAKRTRNLNSIHYILVGDGPEKERLLSYRDRANLTQVHFFPTIGRTEIIDVIDSMDAAIIPLRRIELFQGAIPSKIFEILYLEKPILLGVEGEARELFIVNSKAGLSFEPENDEDLASKIQYLYSKPHFGKEMGKRGKNFVIEYFDRTRLSKTLRSFIQG